MNLEDLQPDDIPQQWRDAARRELRDTIRGRDIAIPDFWFDAIIRAVAPLIRNQADTDAKPERCAALIDVLVRTHQCELPNNHTGRHRFTTEWS